MLCSDFKATFGLLQCVCKDVDGTHFVRDLISIVAHNSIMSDWHYRACRFDLYLGWESEAFSSVPSPMVNKPSYLNHLKFLVSWGAGMAQWGEHSLPTSVARVPFPEPASNVV